MRKIGWILWVLIVVGILSGLVFARKLRSNTVPVARITIHNPYSFAVRMEAKCDWNYRRKKFDFHKAFILRAKGRYVLKVPKKHNRCEIWPKVIW